MTRSVSCLYAAAIAFAAAACAQEAKATEAVAGRYIPGAYAGPGAGIVPPMPGAYWAMANVYYNGSAGTNVPFGDNQIALGLKADIWNTVLAGVYVPNLDLPGNWTYAVQGSLPIGWTKAEADVGRFETVQDVTGIGDIAITPILLGWHNEAFNRFFSASLTVTAPTGEWEKGDIAFIGLNYWTFTPAIAFTYLVPEHGLDLSASLGVDINTKNTDTDYYSGAMAHLDLSVTKNVTKELAFGAVAGFLYQFEDDRSTFADANNGFKGRSIGLGPLVNYKAKFGENTEIDFKLKWVHEVSVENRMKGNAIFFNVAGKF